MYPKFHRHNLLAKPVTQRGSMLIIALFVIIVLALLGITMTRLLSSSSEAIIHEVLGQRALNAARAGLECAVTKQFNDGCDYPETKTFDGVPGLENCSYDVGTTSKNIVDESKTFTYWTFTSTGTCTAGKINVTRNIYIDAII